MATKTITSDKSETKVGSAGTKLYTATRTTYNEGVDGKIDPKSVKQEILYYEAPLSSGVVAATTTGTSQNWTFTNKPLSNNPWLGTDAQKSLKEGALKSTTQQQIQTAATKAKIPPEQQKSLSTKQINTAPNPGTGKPTPGGSASASKEAVSTKDGTRTSYATNMQYPLSLELESQDVIKFSILEYSPSLAAGNQSGGQFGSAKSRVVTLEGNSPIIKGSKRIGVITLPIPAGITDSNPVGWEQDSLNMLQVEAANVAKGLFDGGIEDANKSVGQAADKTAANLGDAETAVKSIFLGSAIQKNISSRAYGAVLNNNVELLFSGPSLRSFSFQFMFYPREPDEAKMVRQIIRAFKQAMSVKRSKSSLLLKAPHTFAISYLTAGQKAHPYLNRFKECALSSCNVEYTPDGTYMTYDGPEKSMTAYRLSLTFQELEPLFDDEYGSDDNNIGF